MHLAEIISGILQFIVAGYALRLNRVFGTARVGWSLFFAFVLLASLHVVQAFTTAHAVTQFARFGTEVEVIYALISLLILTSMGHLESVLKERMKLEREGQRLRAELELEVKKKTAHLTRAIEELEAEIEERRRAEMEVETAHRELRVVSCQAEMARFATGVLEKVAESIRSVNVSASLVSDRVKNSKIANVVNIGTLIRNTSNLGSFMTQDPRGQKLPLYIAQLAEYLATEQTTLLLELEFLKTNLEKIMAMQQDYAKLAGVADVVGISAPRVNALESDDQEFPAEANFAATQEVVEMAS